MNHLLSDPNYNAFVSNHVWLCQSNLVDCLLKEQACGVSIENIVNEYDEEEDEYREIYEWWVCDPWLLDQLEQRREPILRTDVGDWWGGVLLAKPACSIAYCRKSGMI